MSTKHPSFTATVFDFFCLGKKFLVFNMISRNLKSKYRRSFLGVFWTLLSPMAMGIIYYFVFKVILNIQVPHYLTFIMSGVFLWGFFSQTLSEGMESLVGNWGLVSKVPIPIQVFPLVGGLTNLVTLLLAMPIVLISVLFSDVHLGPSVILIPFYCGALFLICYSLSLILAISYVYFRDLRHLLGIILQLWFYSTPVIYDEMMIPEKYRWLLVANPVGHIFVGVHQILIRGVWPEPMSVLIVLGWITVTASLSLFVYRYCSSQLVERM
jgi:ABC-type polysaccharide/polyol phosphate export permease